MLCFFFYKYLIIVEIVLFLQQQHNYVQITYSSFPFFDPEKFIILPFL
jgi:hypothetical protein